MTDARRYAPATERNRDPILDVLRGVLPGTRTGTRDRQRHRRARRVARATPAGADVPAERSRSGQSREHRRMDCACGHLERKRTARARCHGCALVHPDRTGRDSLHQHDPHRAMGGHARSHAQRCRGIAAGRHCCISTDRTSAMGCTPRRATPSSTRTCVRATRRGVYATSKSWSRPPPTRDSPWSIPWRCLRTTCRSCSGATEFELLRRGELRLGRERSLHLAAQLHRGERFVDDHVTPAHRLARGDRRGSFTPCASPSDSAPTARASPAAGMSLPTPCSRPRRRASRRRFRSRFAVATTSARNPVGQPVGSPRTPTDATEMPTSRPIRCQRLYRQA